ncbi:unnamed protein product, partial [Brassica oleracea var. botrytis]
TIDVVGQTTDVGDLCTVQVLGKERNTLELFLMDQK